MSVDLNGGLYSFGGYVFASVREKVALLKGNVVDLSVGDAAYPLAPSVLEAFGRAVREYGDKYAFRGYPPVSGYPFLKEAISRYYDRLGVSVKESEIFITDGAKSEIFRLLSLLGDYPVTVFSPFYPPFAESAVLNGKRVEIIDTGKDFTPDPICLDEKKRIVFLCSPSNPTATVLDCKKIRAWRDYAKSTDSLIIFDGAYADFIRGDFPKTPYLVEGTKENFIELRSFSKFAGFTGMRCGWTVIPESLFAGKKPLSFYYSRFRSSTDNGVNYAVQRAAEAALSEKGRSENSAVIDAYLENARIGAEFFGSKGLPTSGGKDSPYLWVKTPNGLSSEELFEMLLFRAGVAVTPGNGFGKAGEGYFRVSCLKRKEDASSAIERIASSGCF